MSGDSENDTQLEGADGEKPFRRLSESEVIF